MPLRGRLPGAIASLLCAGSLAAAPARAGDSLLVLDPERTGLRFELGATLHTVQGGFRLRGGRVRLDLEAGSASGRVVVDAASGDTGLASRDRNMHAWVLKSAEHPEIVFTPRSLQVLSRSEAVLELRVAGTVEIAGRSHPLEIPLRARIEAGGDVAFESAFAVPYVAWGLTDPSNVLLRVEKEVALEISGRGRLHPAGAPPPAAAPAAPGAPPPAR